MTDYQGMITGMATVQAAAVTTAAAVGVRYAEFALREGANVADTLLSGRGMAGDAIPRLYEHAAEWLRVLASLPRISALVFLGELDRIRGPREVPRESTAAADTQPPSQRSGNATTNDSTKSFS